MSESIITLWINSETNSLLPSWNAFGTATIPSIKQGDSAKVEIHWIKSDQSGNFMSEVSMSPTSTLKLAIGSISGVPTEGYFTYSYQGDTVQIPYDADVTSFPPLNPPVGFVYVEKNANTLINSLPSIIAAGGVVVSTVNQRTLRVVFNNFGVRALSSCDATTLRPSTNVSVTRINIGGATTKEVQHLRPKVLPIAYTDSFFTSPSPVISITDIDSITKRISITPQPKFGTFTISNGTLTTSVLSINASASDVLSALTSANINSLTRLYSVAKSGDYSWDIYRTSGTAETLTVTDSGMIGFESKFGIIDFNTIELEDYLGGAERANATIEVEYSDGTIKQTLYQGTVSIVNDLIENSVYSPIPFPELNAGIGEAPMDSVLYGRKDGVWSAVIGDGNNIPDYDNSIIYTVGNQVYFQGKLYRMQVASGVAGDDPVSSPNLWESLSGSNPILTDYVSKVDTLNQSIASSLTTSESFGAINTVPSVSSASGILGTGFLQINSSIGAGLIPTDEGDGFSSFSVTESAVTATQMAVRVDGLHSNIFEYGGSATDGTRLGIKATYTSPIGNNESTSVFPNGITFTDGTFQSSAGLTATGITMNAGATIGLQSLTSESVFITGSSIGINSPTSVNQTLLTPDSVTVSAPTGSLVVGATGITFPDSTIQTTAAVTPDLSGYAQLTGATFESIIVDYDGSPQYPFRVVSDTLLDKGVMANVYGLLVGKDPASTPFAVYSFLSDNSLSINHMESGQYAGIYTNATNPAIPPVLRMVETNGTTGTNVTEVKQGRIYYDGVELYAPLASPALTGVPTAPTPLASDNSTTIATTAYVTNAVSSATTSASTFKVVETCRNATGSLIPARSVVYINGANGTHPTIQLAQANAESTSYRTFGITSADIANSADGTVVIIGEILNVNTGSFAAGDQLFLSPTIAGGITNVKPSAPDHMVYVGVCTRANTNNGSIEVKVINGFELNELHDVAIASKVDKNLVAYEASTNLWKNKSAATLGIAELSGATFTGKVNTLAPDATSAGINIGSTALLPSTTVAGDLFITGVSLIYKDSNNTQQTLLSGSKPNTIFLNATISGTNTPLSITQSGQILGAKALNVNGLTTLSNPSSSNANGTVSIFNESSGPALKVTTGNVTTAEVVVIESSNSAGTALRITNTGNSNSIIVEDSANPDSSSFVVTSTGKVGIGVQNGFTGSAYKLSIYADSGEAALYLSGQLNTNSGINALGKISSGTFDVNYPSLNLGNACASSPLGAVNGDIWITNATAPKLAYKIGGVNYYPTVANAFNTFTGGIAITGASLSNPQLQVTQNGAGNAVQITTNGTGNALVVEDETSPDAHSFIVNTSGNVGIGVASGYTPVGKLDVNGSITSTTATAGTNSTIVATTAFVKNAVVPSITDYGDGYGGYPAITQWNSIFRMNFTSQQGVYLPSDAQSPVIIGTQVVFVQIGTGRLDFTQQGGATVMSSGGKYLSAQQYSVITAIKTGSSEWLIAGDLSVS
jgi:hypothetical protein